MADFLHRYKAGRPVNEADLAKVHSLMIDELRTNASGHLGRRYPARAAELQVKDPLTLFPAFALDAYLRPATSPDDPTQGWPGFGNGEAVFHRRGKARSEGRGDMEYSSSQLLDPLDRLRGRPNLANRSKTCQLMSSRSTHPVKTPQILISRN